METCEEDEEEILSALNNELLTNDPLDELIITNDEYAFVQWLELGKDILDKIEYKESLVFVKDKLLKYEKFEWLKHLK